MSRQDIPASVRMAVRSRASERCEYCGVPEIGAFFAPEPDHIIARQHRGETRLENLALACLQCNRCKGPNVASVDPITNEIVRLFNPRTDRWHDHFVMENGQIIPLTSIGRATAALRDFNQPDRQETRRVLLGLRKAP